MSKKEDKKDEERYADPVSRMAIMLMTEWSKNSIKSSQDRLNVEKFILNSDKKEILTAYTHIRKFNSFPNENFFHVIGERVSRQDLRLSRDFLQSKLRSNTSMKVDVGNTRKR